MTASSAPAIFGRILVGIDGSPESIEAARQASRLSTGELTLLAAWQLPPPPAAGMGVPSGYAQMDDEPYRAAAANSLEDARRVLDGGRPVVKTVRAVAWEALLDEVEEGGRSLVAVGSHGQSRARGIVLGSTTTELVHKAPCPVLVVRPASREFPKRVVVGVDGSAESEEAYAVAGSIADRFQAELWPIVARGGDGFDKGRVREIVGRYEELPDDPVRALVASSADADLVVVGSRGLHGLKALGSVSERVAHTARCSTLVVRREPLLPPR
jgi:nucleotide-binding universal stress UspA family protein